MLESLKKCLITPKKRLEKLSKDLVLLSLMLLKVSVILRYFRDHHMSLIMELSIMDSGQKMVIEMEKELRFGKMAVSLLATGVTTRLTVKDDLFMLMAMYTKEIGSTIKLRAEARMSIWMAPSMLESGEKIDNMGMELKAGQIMLNMKAIMNMVKNTE